jgi:purine nucleoside phosphorylase I, inosine and guanosine-specific
MDMLRESAEYIKSRINGETVDVAIVLGSGLGDFAEELEDTIFIPYGEIPHFPVSTAPGHKGRLAIGRLNGKRVMCMQGRFHFYEGWSMQQVVYPIETMHVMGIDNLFLTNAAGCVNTEWEPGNLMIITDHIKLMPESPMIGANEDELGDRFFDMSRTYNPSLVNHAENCGRKLGILLKKGTYMLFAGPQFETPAEVRFARLAGADAVGMSTVPEAIAASHMRMNVLGISCMTNMGAGILDQPLNHEEVLEMGRRVKGEFTALVKEIITTWPAALKK